MARKSKIFFGTLAAGVNKTADKTFNQWLNENPNVEIISVQYNQARMGDHSIFVFYNDEPMAPVLTGWPSTYKPNYGDPFSIPTPTYEVKPC